MSPGTSITQSRRREQLSQRTALKEKPSKFHVSKLLQLSQPPLPFGGPFFTQEVQGPGGWGPCGRSLSQGKQSPWAGDQKASSHQPHTHCVRILLSVRDQRLQRSVVGILDNPSLKHELNTSMRGTLTVLPIHWACGTLGCIPNAFLTALSI